jgi:putative ABC transport system ATP-binding protein
MPKLEVRNLTVEYTSGGYVVRALDKLRFDAANGELVLLVGPSGCGKTTLLSCLAGILRPTSGTIRWGRTRVTDLDGARLTDYRRNTVGVVFQSFNLVGSLSALENVDTPLRAAGVKASGARERASELLDLVGLNGRSQHRPGDLSGGEQQRVAIARALVHDPPLLLADEPTAHLDYVQVEGVLRLLRSLARPGRVVVVSTHDDRLIPLADRVVELVPRGERRVVEGPKRMTFDEGELLFRQGTMGQHIYVIESGTVEVFRELSNGREESLATYETGEYFGELGPLLGFPRAATARAKRFTTCMAYTVPEFKEFLGSDRVADVMSHGRKSRVRKRAVSKRG